jgi:co-chaperonin GroES (HSP10)
MAQNSEHALALAFPAVDAGIQPFGSRVLVQIRNPREVTQSGIILTRDTKDTDKWNTTTAKVISVGPLAFKNRNTMAAWPEGDWCAPGEYVRVPKYGGDRWEVAKSDSEVGLFVILNDLDIIGRVTGDPLAIRAFI